MSNNVMILPKGAQCSCGYTLENDAPIGAGCPKCSRRLVPAEVAALPGASEAEVKRLVAIIEAKEASILELQKKLEEAVTAMSTKKKGGK